MSDSALTKKETLAFIKKVKGKKIVLQEDTNQSQIFIPSGKHNGGVFYGKDSKGGNAEYYIHDGFKSEWKLYKKPFAILTPETLDRELTFFGNSSKDDCYVAAGCQKISRKDVAKINKVFTKWLKKTK